MITIAGGVAENFPGRVALFLGPLSPGTRTEADADRLVTFGDEHKGMAARLAVGDLDGDAAADLVLGGLGNSAMRGHATILLGTDWLWGAHAACSLVRLQWRAPRHRP
mgnify:FL=1